MSSELGKFVEDVQKEMWSGYTETVIAHATNPRNIGNVPNADGFRSITGFCGDTMQIWLKVKEGTISDAKFWTDGCGTTIAAGSMVTELAKGRKIGEAHRLSQDDILKALGSLPEESLHCAALAADALKVAIRDYLAYTKEPWKRAYQQRY